MKVNKRIAVSAQVVLALGGNRAPGVTSLTWFDPPDLGASTSRSCGLSRARRPPAPG